jgi:CheY-like chemotaxis protein
MAADRRQLAELGVTAVLAKPFDPLTLGSRIGEMLGWPAGAAA